MANLTIRNVEDEVVGRLRRRAAQSGRSLEEELRRVLRRAANADVDLFLAWVNERRLPLPDGADPVAAIAAERRAG